MRSPSLDFALRAILRMSQFAPGELVLLAQEKGTRRLARYAGSLRFSPFRALAELAEFAAPSASKSSSNRAARSIPKWLRCSAAPDGFQHLLVVL